MSDGNPYHEARALGAWRAKATTDLFRGPDSKIPVATVASGEMVTALAAKKYNHRGTLRVIWPHKNLGLSEIIYLLEYNGEGFWLIEHNGKVLDDSFRLDNLMMAMMAEGSSSPFFEKAKYKPSAKIWAAVGEPFRVDAWFQLMTSKGRRDPSRCSGSRCRKKFASTRVSRQRLHSSLKKTSRSIGIEGSEQVWQNISKVTKVAKYPTVTASPPKSVKAGWGRFIAPSRLTILPRMWR